MTTPPAGPSPEAVRLAVQVITCALNDDVEGIHVLLRDCDPELLVAAATVIAMSYIWTYRHMNGNDASLLASFQEWLGGQALG